MSNTVVDGTAMTPQTPHRCMNSRPSVNGNGSTIVSSVTKSTYCKDHSIACKCDADNSVNQVSLSSLDGLPSKREKRKALTVSGVLTPNNRFTRAFHRGRQILQASDNSRKHDSKLTTISPDSESFPSSLNSDKTDDDDRSNTLVRKYSLKSASFLNSPITERVKARFQTKHIPLLDGESNKAPASKSKVQVIFSIPISPFPFYNSWLNIFAASLYWYYNILVLPNPLQSLQNWLPPVRTHHVSGLGLKP